MKSASTLPPRELSPYEKNQLLRHNIDPTKIGDWKDAPVEYITGVVEFAGQEFTVTRDVLIPRVETEVLVQLVVQDILALPNVQQRTEPLRIAEIGTGSGAISATLYLALKKLGIPVHIWASDVSAAALKVARTNFEKLHIPVQDLATEDKKIDPGITLLQSDLWSSFPTELTFSLVVANLPYIPTPRIKNLDSSVKDWEPIMALDGGEDGLILITQLLAEAPAHLSSPAHFWLEVDDTHTTQMLSDSLNQISELNFNLIDYQDQFDKPRFIRAKPEIIIK
jgi:release factor glutamine methyltransferase